MWQCPVYMPTPSPLLATDKPARADPRPPPPLYVPLLHPRVQGRAARWNSYFSLKFEVKIDNQELDRKGEHLLVL
jgi:hypothetical protein